MADPDIAFAVSRQPGQTGTTVRARKGTPQGTPSQQLSDLSYYENALPNGFVLPYDAQTAGEQGGNGAVPGFFLTRLADSDCYVHEPSLAPAPCAPDPYVYRFAPEGDVVVPAGAVEAWDLPGVSLLFGPNSHLVAPQPLSISGATLTASDLSRGWGGIRYTSPSGTPMATSTLSHVTVSGVRTFLPPDVLPGTVEPIGAAVTVAGRTVILTDSTLIERGDDVNSGAQTLPDGVVYPTNGVQVTGANGWLTVTGQSRVLNHGGVGVLATGGGGATVSGQSFVRVNAYGGVRATGFGSNVSVAGYAQVSNNLAAGVRSDQQGTVSVRSPGGTNTNTSVSDNVGGLYAHSGAGISGKQCDDTTSGPTRPNVFERNFITGYDATAFGGSLVLARYAYWGGGRTTLVTDRDNSSVLLLSPRATTPDAQQPGCASYRAGGTTGRFAALAYEEDAVQGRGPASTAVTALTAQAREAAWDGNTAAAFAAVAQAQAVSLTTDDREAVSEAMGSLLASARPASVVRGLETEAATPGDGQVWAQRALAVAYAADGRAVDADALALILTANSETSHAAFGHSLRVRLAADAGDEMTAMDRLSTFASLATESDEALGSAVALVAATFPDADLSAVLGIAGRSAGRGASTSETAAVSAAGKAADASLNALDVYPNPAASGQATLRVTLAVAAESVGVTVYDALGRRVAVLHDGALMAGTTNVPLGPLAPGVFVVHVRVSAVAGAAWTDVRRITVTR